MSTILFRRAASAAVVLAAGLLAAACSSLKVEPKDDVWTVAGAGDGRTASTRTGEVETLVHLVGAEGEFPVNVTFFNYGPTPVVVRIDAAFHRPDDLAIGETRPSAPDEGSPVALRRSNSLCIPASVDGAPGAVRVALRCDVASPDERPTPDDGADATYEVVMQTAGGEVRTPLRFRVAKVDDPWPVIRIAGVAVGALVAIAVVSVAVLIISLSTAGFP